ncbi:histidine phosphatase superfamily [Chlamydoabsidia padenii]|nr:histidine phosphatase superfamily [Chlamydoabsidia padenii]
MAPTVSTIDTVFIVRHGERIDHINALWEPDPAHGLNDPPLSLVGHTQAEMTGKILGELIKQQRQGMVSPPIIVIYSSPFQRCIDTSIGIIKGLEQHIDPQYPPILRMDLGLGEWMSDQFYDDISCSGPQFLARHQEELARRQAMHYQQLSLLQHDSPPSPPPCTNDDDTMEQQQQQQQPFSFLLPPMTVDYGYHSSQYTDFDFPESYTDMLHRFDQTRRQCIDHATRLPKKYKICHTASPVFVIMVTHAIGINALLDSFRNTTTRPVKTPYCCISRFQYKPDLKSATSILKKAQNILENDEDDDGWLDPTSLKIEQPKWIPDLIADDTHLTILSPS